jgi:hypothetical protein
MIPNVDSFFNFMFNMDGQPIVSREKATFQSKNMVRVNNNPTVELHETDRSNYDSTVDNSRIGTSTLVCGFFDKGEDYAVTWVNSIGTLQKLYGTPKTEAETWSYNACAEILNGGGVLYVAKLPYDNNSKDMISYTSYKVGEDVQHIRSTREYLETECQVGEEYSDVPGTVSTLFEELVGAETGSINNTTIANDTLGDLFKVNSLLAYDLVNFILATVPFRWTTKEDFSKAFLKDKMARRDTLLIAKAIFDGSKADYSEIGIPDEAVEDMKMVYDDYDALKDAFIRTITTERVVEAYDILSGNEEITRLHMFEDIWLDILGGKSELADVDDGIRSYVEITSYDNDTDNQHSGMVPMSDFDLLKTGELKVPPNQIRIFDITRGQYGTDWNVESKFDSETLPNPDLTAQTDPNANYTSEEYLGIVPVITTATNALMFQGILKTGNFLEKYNPVSKLQTTWNKDRYSPMKEGWRYVNFVEIDEKNLANPLGSENPDIWTTGRAACENFPNIITGADGTLERKYLKQIGLVVFRMVRDASMENLVRLVPAESYVGSLDPTDKDPVTNKSTYIGNQVNLNSNLVNFFSNVKFSKKNDKLNETPCDKADIYTISNQFATSLGFFASDRKKDISVKNSILDPMDLIFRNASNTTTLDLDIILDAGISNIAQFIASTKVMDENKKKIADRTKRKGEFDLFGDDSRMFTPTAPDSSVVWRMVVEKYKNFCQTMRKDCMFICDGLRSICLDGNQKVIRRTAPANTIENSILPYIKNISGINTSYGAGYCDWFYTTDAFSGDLFWCPPSIKTVGRYLYTDIYGKYWLAPAGLHRGLLGDVVDVAFSMTNAQAGFVYGNCWNYATNWPLDGIAVEGQRTFQIEKTALDRVNVRRLLLGLEKSVRRIGRYFLYEGLTQYNVQRFSDAINRILSDVQDAGGIREFVVICDDSNNTVETIDRNELHCTIALIPVKAIEWIVINTVTTNQGANVEEIARAEL